MGSVVHLPCDTTFIGRIMEPRLDFVFNIAEGWGGRDRESFVPIVCRMLGIPCTGSDAITLGITMDKALTKHICSHAGVHTAPSIVYRTVPDSPPPFGFPAFVKPNCDGSSRGITRESLATDLETLAARVSVILREYRQAALVEPYLDGRDFCVGLLGNDPPELLRPCEVLLGHEDGIPFFSHEYKRYDIDRLDFAPDINPAAIDEMVSAARKSYAVLGCLDYARFDFRTDRDGIPYLLEVNALPGLSPRSGIFVRQAASSGIGYEKLILRVAERILKTVVG
jgi:D-alanine-D-alanine ligase